jgi:hypothetical protein
VTCERSRVRQPNGATIVIPPRPFLHPVMEKHKDEIKQMFEKQFMGFFTKQIKYVF